jgi:ribosomal RNA-processing protein 8
MATKRKKRSSSPDAKRQRRPDVGEAKVTPRQSHIPTLVESVEKRSKRFSGMHRDKRRKKGKHQGNLSDMQAKMKKKLDAAKFRFINEQLYTSSSADGLEMMEQDPEQFAIYHRGFTDQMKKWPVNPVSIFGAMLRKVGRPLVVVDFGCGDAKIARSAPKRHTIHSFDLVAANEHVVACDMAHVPLKDGVADMAIFCLSLMGTNVKDFLLEARRVLKRGGVLLIAEVKSRFEEDSAAVAEARGGRRRSNATVGGGVRGFVAALETLGFDLQAQQLGNRMFAVFRFKLAKREPQPDSFRWSFRACTYKKR